MDADGKLKFVVDATADELKNAPEFMTLAALKRQNDMNQPPAGSAATPEPSPAAPVAPAPAQ